jgi:hypothetical protein
MGKYTHLRHKLPAFEQSAEASGLSAWFAKVNEWKQEFLGATRGEDANAGLLAREYAERDTRKKELEAEISQLNIELKALSDLGVESLESDGMQKIDLAAGGYVSISDKPRTSTEDKAKVLAWIKKNKMQDLLTLSYQTLSAMNNERLLAGKAVIPGTKIFMDTKLTVRGVSARNGDSDE